MQDIGQEWYDSMQTSEMKRKCDAEYMWIHVYNLETTGKPGRCSHIIYKSGNLPVTGAGDRMLLPTGN